jgi:hypothetical protein
MSEILFKYSIWLEHIIQRYICYKKIFIDSMEIEFTISFYENEYGYFV